MSVYEVNSVVLVMFLVSSSVVFFTYRTAGNTSVAHLLAAQTILVFAYSTFISLFVWEKADIFFHDLVTRLCFVAAILISTVNVFFVASFCGRKLLEWQNVLILIGGIIGLFLVPGEAILLQINGLKLSYGWGQYYVFLHSLLNVLLAVYYLNQNSSAGYAFQFKSMRNLQIASFMWTLTVNGIIPRLIGDSRYAFVAIFGLAVFTSGCLFLLMYGREISIGRSMRPIFENMLADPLLDNELTSAESIAYLHSKNFNDYSANLHKLQERVVVQGAALDQARFLIDDFQKFIDKLQVKAPDIPEEYIVQKRPDSREALDVLTGSTSLIARLRGLKQRIFGSLKKKSPDLMSEEEVDEFLYLAFEESMRQKKQRPT